jgi:hypothetical protein
MNKPVFERDMDLVRAILVWAENGGAKEMRPNSDGVALCYHVKIAKEADLIDGAGDLFHNPRTGGWEPGLLHVKMLTWKGQDFLAAVRSDTVWNHIKAKAKEYALPALLEVMRAYAVSCVTGTQE